MPGGRVLQDLRDRADVGRMHALHGARFGDRGRFERTAGERGS